MSKIRLVHNFLQLSQTDIQLIFTTVVLLSVIRLGMFFLPFRILLKLLRSNNYVVSRNENARKVSISKIIWAVNVATRYTPGRAKCLARALTTQVLMSRYSYPCKLCIGVAKAEVGIQAHAWVEYQGRVAIGNLTDLERFVPLTSLE
jgi:hypothetical protein